MKKEAIWLCLWLAGATGLAGCAHKPAYNEMDANRASRNQNQNQASEGGQPAAPAASETPPPATDAAQPTPTPTFKNPTFLDSSNSGIKDLPSYPNAYRISVQIGPIQGVNTMSLGLTTSDSMDKVAAFYDKVAKEHKWTVVSKVIDPEFSEWTLKKGETQDAKVQVKKDPPRPGLTIVMVRSEKMDVPK